MAAETTGPSSTLAEAGEPKGLTISVKQMNSDTYRVSLLDTATVRELKQKIASLSDVTVDRQRLIYQGKVLIDAASTLKDYGVKDEHTIHLVARPTEADPERQSTNDQPTSPRASQARNAAAGGNQGHGSRAEMVVTFGAMELPPQLASNLQQAMQRQQQQQQQTQQASTASTPSTSSTSSTPAATGANPSDTLAMLQSMFAPRNGPGVPPGTPTALPFVATVAPRLRQASRFAIDTASGSTEMRPASHLYRIQTHIRNIQRFLSMGLTQTANTLPIEEIRLPTANDIRAMRAEESDVRRTARLIRDVRTLQQQLGERMERLAQRYEAGSVDVGVSGGEAAVVHEGAVVSNVLYRLAQINMLLFPLLASTAIATHPNAHQPIYSTERSIWFHAPFMPPPVSIASGTPQTTADETPRGAPQPSGPGAYGALSLNTAADLRAATRIPPQTANRRQVRATAGAPPAASLAVASAPAPPSAPADSSAPTASSSSSSSSSRSIDVPQHLYASAPPSKDAGSLLRDVRGAFQSMLALHPLTRSAQDDPQSPSPRLAHLIRPRGLWRPRNPAERFLLKMAEHFSVADVQAMLDGDLRALATLPAFLLPHLRAMMNRSSGPCEESEMNALAMELAAGLMKIDCDNVDAALESLLTTNVELLQAMENTLIYALKRLIWQMVLSAGERPESDPAFPRFVKSWFADLIEDWTRSIQDSADDATRPKAIAFQHYIMQNILYNLFSEAWDRLSKYSKPDVFQQLADAILVPSTTAIAASLREQRQREASSTAADETTTAADDNIGKSRVRPTPPSPVHDSASTDHHARSMTPNAHEEHRDNSKRRRLHTDDASNSGTANVAGAPPALSSEATTSSSNQPGPLGDVTLDDGEADQYQVTVSIEVEEQVMPDID